MSRNCESSVCPHSLELEFLNEKYREVLAHNSALRDQLSSRMQDPIKYLKLCEELTKVSQSSSSSIEIEMNKIFLLIFFRREMN